MRCVPPGFSMLLDPPCTARVASYVLGIISKPKEGAYAVYLPDSACCRTRTKFLIKEYIE